MTKQVKFLEKKYNENVHKSFLSKELKDKLVVYLGDRKEKEFKQRYNDYLLGGLAKDFIRKLKKRI